MQRLLNAAQAGHAGKLHKILEHELSVVPLSLENTEKKMNSTQKSAMIPLLTKGLGVEKV